MIVFLKTMGSSLLFIGIFFLVNNVYRFVNFGIQTIPCIVLIGMGCWFFSLAIKEKRSKGARNMND